MSILSKLRSILSAEPKQNISNGYDRVADHLRKLLANPAALDAAMRKDAKNDASPTICYAIFKERPREYLKILATGMLLDAGLRVPEMDDVDVFDALAEASGAIKNRPPPLTYDEIIARLREQENTCPNLWAEANRMLAAASLQPIKPSDRITPFHALGAARDAAVLPRSYYTAPPPPYVDPRPVPQHFSGNRDNTKKFVNDVIMAHLPPANMSATLASLTFLSAQEKGIELVESYMRKKMSEGHSYEKAVEIMCAEPGLRSKWVAECHQARIDFLQRASR